jgi:hypothetical protein
MTHTRINTAGQRQMIFDPAVTKAAAETSKKSFPSWLRSKSSYRRQSRLTAKIRHSIKHCTCASYGPDSCRSCGDIVPPTR